MVLAIILCIIIGTLDILFLWCAIDIIRSLKNIEKHKKDIDTF